LFAEVGEFDKGVIISLGSIAHRAILKAWGLTLAKFPFAHGAEYNINGNTLLASYHCSRYNTQTRRLSRHMFENIFQRACEILDAQD
jgi:uracil-DNA glycosylase